MDFQLNDDSITPSYSMDTHHELNSGNSYIVSNTNEFIEALNRSSVVNSFNTFENNQLGDYPMSHQTQQYSFLNTQHQVNELKEFKMPSFDNIKQIILDIEQYLEDKQLEIENLGQVHRKLIEDLATNPNSALDDIKQLFHTYIQNIETTNSALSELCVPLYLFFNYGVNNYLETNLR